MKAKTKKTGRYHKKMVGLHQKRSPDFLKAYHPFIPLLAFVLVGLALFSFRTTPNQQNEYISQTQTVESSQDQPSESVLGYATNMSTSGLLASTNQRRSAAGLGGLTLNSKLNSAAQAKANDMASRNYWSHNTPDGNPPWLFMNNAGYGYSKAGENLACGFDSSTEVITGWYNSASHKANLLDKEYKDVGFGIVNANNYNCGQWSASPQTIVVAMYGTPKSNQSPAPASATSPLSQNQGSSNGTEVKSSSGSGAQSDTKNSSNSSRLSTKVDSHDVVLTVINIDGTASKNTKVTLNSTPRTAYTDDNGVVKFSGVEPGKHRIEVDTLGAKSETTIELDGKQKLFELSIIKPEPGANSTGNLGTSDNPKSQPVSRVSVFVDGFAPYVTGLLAVLSVAGTLYLLGKHSKAAHKFFVKGEKYILKHKLVDIGIIGLVVLLFYITRTAGVIL